MRWGGHLSYEEQSQKRHRGGTLLGVQSTGEGTGGAWQGLMACAKQAKHGPVFAHPRIYLHQCPNDRVVEEFLLSGSFSISFILTLRVILLSCLRARTYFIFL